MGMLKVPLSWLKDYVDLTLSPDELAAGLTLRGIEVEGVHRTGKDWDRVVVGEVLTKERHPNADRLVVHQVAVGQQNGGTFQIVTGAMNLNVGDKAPVALSGARLIDGHKLDDERKAGKRTGSLLAGDIPYFTVKPGKMRGLDSQAVLVAHLELGISEEFEGIVVLDPKAEIGATLESVLGETVLDIDLSPNLGRVLSMYGIAREVGAMTGQKARFPHIAYQETDVPITELVAVRIEAPDLCPRFALSYLDGFTNFVSPEWMQRRLVAAGQRSISLIVDITNYVMLEIGQPSHAFDYDDIALKTIVVRRARDGEKIETIDHEIRTLDTNTLVVADPECALAVAGVMGGAMSEIKDGTQRVALEAAHWNPQYIRHVARNVFNSYSEAAKRYERYVDIALPPVGARRVAQLAQELGGARVARGVIDAYPQPEPTRVIHFPLAEIPRLLGISVPGDAVKAMLEELEFGVEPVADDTLDVTVPSYRNDVTIKADLVEEVARMYGYDKIPEASMSGALPAQTTNRELLFNDKVRDTMRGAGLNEVISYALIDMEDLKRLHAGSGDHANHHWLEDGGLLRLQNADSTEHEYMRPTLLTSMVTTVRTNLTHSDRVQIYEVGRVYLPRTDQPLPDERRTLAFAITGTRHDRSRYNPRPTEADAVDFFDAKGVVEALLDKLAIPAVTYERAPESTYPAFHPGRVATVMVGVGRGQTGTVIGVIGELHPKAAEAFGLEGRRIYVGEFDIEKMRAAVIVERYTPISKQPPVTQDIALVVAEDVPAGDVTRLIRETGGKLLTDLTLFDIYRGASIPTGAKSLAYSMAFQTADRSLTEDEVTKLRQKIEGRLKRELNADVRGT